MEALPPPACGAMALPESTERLELAIHELQLVVVLLRPNPEAALRRSEHRHGRGEGGRARSPAAAFDFQEEEGVVKEQGQVPGPAATNDESDQEHPDDTALLARCCPSLNLERHSEYEVMTAFGFACSRSSALACRLQVYAKNRQGES